MSMALWCNRARQSLVIERAVRFVHERVQQGQRDFRFLQDGSADGSLLLSLRAQLKRRFPDVTFKFFGVDIQADEIMSAAGIRIETNDVMIKNGRAEDPSVFGHMVADGFFDVVIDYGLSVHDLLSRAQAETVIEKWSRQLKPGGVALLMPYQAGAWIETVPPPANMTVLARIIPEMIFSKKQSDPRLFTILQKNGGSALDAGYLMNGIADELAQIERDFQYTFFPSSRAQTVFGADGIGKGTVLAGLWTLFVVGGASSNDIFACIWIAALLSAATAWFLFGFVIRATPTRKQPYGRNYELDVHLLERRYLLSGVALPPVHVAVAQNNTAAEAAFREHKPAFDAARSALAAAFPANNIAITDFSSMWISDGKLEAGANINAAGRVWAMTAVMDQASSRMIEIAVDKPGQYVSRVGLSPGIQGWDLFGSVAPANYLEYRDYLKPVAELGAGVTQKAEQLLAHLDSNTRMYGEFYAQTQTIGPITVVANTSSAEFQAAVSAVARIFSDLDSEITAKLQEFVSRAGVILSVLSDHVPTMYDIPTLMNGWDLNWGGVTSVSSGLSYSLAYNDPLLAYSVTTHEVMHLVQGIGFSDERNQLLQSFYDSAMAQGLYANAYASTNALEYFAETASFFLGIPRYGHLGGIAALSDPVTFAAYDPAMAAFLKEILNASTAKPRADLLDVGFQGAAAVKNLLEKSLNSILPRSQRAHVTLVARTFDDRIEYAVTVRRRGTKPAKLTVIAPYPRGQFDGRRRLLLSTKKRTIVVDKFIGSNVGSVNFKIDGKSVGEALYISDLKKLGRALKSMLAPPRPARAHKLLRVIAPALLLVVGALAGTAAALALGPSSGQGDGGAWMCCALLGMAIVSHRPRLTPQLSVPSSSPLTASNRQGAITALASRLLREVVLFHTLNPGARLSAHHLPDTAMLRLYRLDLDRYGIASIQIEQLSVAANAINIFIPKRGMGIRIARDAKLADEFFDLIEFLDGSEVEVDTAESFHSDVMPTHYWRSGWIGTIAHTAYRRFIGPLAATTAAQLIASAGKASPRVLDFFGGDGYLGEGVRAELVSLTGSSALDYHVLDQVDPASARGGATHHSLRLSETDDLPSVLRGSMDFVLAIGALNFNVIPSARAKFFLNMIAQTLVPGGTLILLGYTFSLVNKKMLEQAGFEVRNMTLPAEYVSRWPRSGKHELDEWIATKFNRQLYVAVKKPPLNTMMFRDLSLAWYLHVNPSSNLAMLTRLVELIPGLRMEFSNSSGESIRGVQPSHFWSLGVSQGEWLRVTVNAAPGTPLAVTTGVLDLFEHLNHPYFDQHAIGRDRLETWTKTVSEWIGLSRVSQNARIDAENNRAVVGSLGIRGFGVRPFALSENVDSNTPPLKATKFEDPHHWENAA
jgi:SAM-dependent methyltransferase